MPIPSNPQNWNRYSYVSNNPLRYIDPTGHMQVSDDHKSSDGRCRTGDTSCNWTATSKAREYLRAHRDKSTDICFMCKSDPELKLEPDYTFHKKDAIFPVKQEFHLGAVGWFDIAVNGVGIAGDFSLFSTLVNPGGPEEWALTEGVEVVGLLKDGYKGDLKALRQDGVSKAIEVVGELKRSAILIPAVGLYFNGLNIYDAWEEGWVDVPDVP